MRIELRSSNLSISEPLFTHVARKVNFAVRRFASRVEHVVVRLVDVNGPKGGPDKRCRIVARLSSGRSVIVEATDADAYASASQAATRLGERVSRSLTRGRPRPLTTRHGGERHLRRRGYALGPREETV